MSKQCVGVALSWCDSPASSQLVSRLGVNWGRAAAAAGQARPDVARSSLCTGLELRCCGPDATLNRSVFQRLILPASALLQRLI